jgi:Na+/glutamate symporter
LAAINFLKLGIAAAAAGLAAGCAGTDFPRRLIKVRGLYASPATEANERIKRKVFTEGNEGNEEKNSFIG